MDKLAEKRRARGQVNEADMLHYALYSKSDLIRLLKADDPVARTCGALHLQKHKERDVVIELCRRLMAEKKLYARIALCDTLVEFGELSLKPVFELLGGIGNNQEKTVAETGFYKFSYPLPRDIAARVICRIGVSAVAALESYLESSRNIKGVAEAIDAYGNIIYSNRLPCSSVVLQKIVENHPDNDLLTFKVTRCLSGIKDQWSRQFLLHLLEEGSRGLRLAALRSLLLLQIEIPEKTRNGFTAEMISLESFLLS